jgi:hypothetical protein
MAKSNKRIRRNLKFIGGILILLSPILFAFSFPLLQHLCSTEVLECGYKNLGATGYSLYLGLIPLTIGALILIVEFIIGFKKNK